MNQGSAGDSPRTHLWRSNTSMKRLMLATVMVCTTSAMSLGAQGGGQQGMPGAGLTERRPGGGNAVNNPAEFLLSQTGELKLTDAQVTRLAAIARRSVDRRRALRLRMDSLRPERRQGTRPDSASRERMRERFDQMRPALDQLREQSQADRRDAIAVLSPDQQAQAWERIARSGRDGRLASRGGMDGPGRRGMRPGGVSGDRMRRPGFAPRRIGPPRNGDGGTPGERRRPAARPRPEAQDSL